jgi:hypothetical protein
MAERVIVTEAAAHYEDAIAGAMVKMKDKIEPDAQVHRTAPACQEMRDWYVEDAESTLSGGEQMIMVTVTFQLAGSDL